MAYGLGQLNITDDNWHLVTNREAVIKCSRSYIFRYGTSTAPSNSDDVGIAVDEDFVVTNGSNNSYVYVKRLESSLPLNVVYTGDVV
jgi:hypothetical protein